MLYSKKIVRQVASTLLTRLFVKDPTSEQYQAAESFSTMVILPPQEKRGTQESLTATEWFCFNLAASGFSTEETAEKLSLARGTIKNYRERIRQKLQCKNMTQAVYKAFIETSALPEPKQNPVLARFYDWVKQRTKHRLSTRQVNFANDKTYHPNKFINKCL